MIIYFYKNSKLESLLTIPIPEFQLLSPRIKQRHILWRTQTHSHKKNRPHARDKINSKYLHSGAINSHAAVGRQLNE